MTAIPSAEGALVKVKYMPREKRPKAWRRTGTGRWTVGRSEAMVRSIRYLFIQKNLSLGGTWSTRSRLDVWQ